MTTINQQQFEQLCEEVRRDAVVILDGAVGAAEQTRRLLSALLARVCAHLAIDLDAQITALQDRDGFALLQTLEEHMQPEFSYSTVLDTHLLTALQPGTR